MSKKETPEYEWNIQGLKFEVWEQPSSKLEPSQFACKVIHESGHIWLERTDTVSGCAFHAMNYMEKSNDVRP